MLDELRQFHLALKALRSQINKETGPRISKKKLCAETERLSTFWFSDLVSCL